MNDAGKRPRSSETEIDQYQQVLVAVADPETASEAVRLACRVTDSTSVLHIINVTAELPFHKRAKSWRTSSGLVMEMTQWANELERVAKPLAATAKSVPDGILNAAEGIGADLVILGWHGQVTPLAVRRSSVVRRVLEDVDSDSVVLKSRNSLEDAARCVVPIHPKFNRGRLGFVTKFLYPYDTPVLLVHVITPDSELSEQQAVELLREPAEFVGAPAETRVVEAGGVVEGILQAVREDDLLVIGPGREWVFKRFLFGHHADHLANEAPCSVVMFKARERKITAWLLGLLKAVASKLAGSGMI